MKGLFIPGITAEMFKNGCLESIEVLMAEGEIYDIDYPLKQEPCEDAISRQAVLDLCDSKDLDYKVIHFKEDVECLPSVIQQPKIGHWIDNHNNTISCDRCHTWFNKDDRYGYMHYCPNCGAKMQEVEE